MRGNRVYRTALQQKITARTGRGRDELVKRLRGKHDGGRQRERETKTGREGRMQRGQRLTARVDGYRDQFELQGVSLFETKGGSIAMSAMFNQLFMIC